jgi:ribosomal protein S18 acetylase RimI-like enzyme
MDLIIRMATAADSKVIARYLLLAMEDIVYGFIGRRDAMKALAFMEYCVERPNNQYSWQNCLVAEEHGQVVAAINVYDGARLQELRQPVVEAIHRLFGRQVLPEDETQAGEYYIDTLGVNPDCQGRGIGTRLLQHLIRDHVNNQGHTLGILVDDDNPEARKLYLRLGFRNAGKKVLMGKNMEHLQIRPSAS